ncbi:hypothetical protein [Paludibaculum fermentans]|uniref:hypothetical protein n=1 Tax=Paludibaculum fermentans TaxID=1473598 RepID=UPI003EB921B1
MKNWLFGILLFAAPVWAGDEQRPPIAEQPVVELTGTVTRVQIAMGQGMPYLEVKTAKGTVRLYLGSMRYLVQENFTPKAGDLLEAKGYKMADSVVAIRVELPASKKVLKLRDENGWPLWMGGRRRGEGGPD